MTWIAVIVSLWALALAAVCAVMARMVLVFRRLDERDGREAAQRAKARRGRSK